MRPFRPSRCAVLALIAAAALAAAETSEASARMQVEIDAAAGSAAAAAPDPRLNEHMMGLAAEMSDQLTDIMASLQHGSDSARDAAVARLGQLSIATAEAGREQARMFRSAVVVGGALPELVSMLGSEQTRRQALAAEAIHTLAIDDPTSDADNFHSLEICQSGAVAPLVAMLSSTDEAAQAAATGALSCLAENPVCQQMIAGAGALAPLMKLTQSPRHPARRPVAAARPPAARHCPARPGASPGAP